MDGIFNINKPAGMTSNACLGIVKKRLGVKKAGFLGTLDPAASGVLIILCGKCTKMANELHEGAKTYQSCFQFGLETDTLDATGTTIATSDIIPTRAQIEKILPEMVGDIEIEVPRYSAVHIDGKRAYDLARGGVDFVPPKRVVKITRFELLDTPNHVTTHISQFPLSMKGVAHP